MCLLFYGFDHKKTVDSNKNVPRQKNMLTIIIVVKLFFGYESYIIVGFQPSSNFFFAKLLKDQLNDFETVTEIYLSRDFGNTIFPRN